MSGRGETPQDNEGIDSVSIGPGEMLYTEDGAAIGEVRGVEEAGLFISLRDGAEALSIEHVRSGQSFGAAELMWRCIECGEMGEIDDGLPESCPNCAAPIENLMYWTED